MTLTKKASLYDRDEKGELLPLEVKVEVSNDDEFQKEFEDETIKLIPIPRGKIKRLFSDMGKEDKDEQEVEIKIILEHCIDPKYTEKELAHIKPALATVLVNTIFRESGLSVNKNRKKAVLQAEDDFAKN